MEDNIVTSFIEISRERTNRTGIDWYVLIRTGLNQIKAARLRRLCKMSLFTCLLLSYQVTSGSDVISLRQSHAADLNICPTTDLYIDLCVF